MLMEYFNTSFMHPFFSGLIFGSFVWGGVLLSQGTFPWIQATTIILALIAEFTMFLRFLRRYHELQKN